MTHSKIQKMKFIVFLFIFLFAQIAICDDNLREKGYPVNPVPAEKVDLVMSNKKDEVQKNHDPLGKKTNETSEKPGSSVDPLDQTEEEHTPLTSDALRRGFYVFLCFGVLVIAYIAFRTFRINKSRTQMIRKYGVLTHRQDVEMRPLPLDEDDEDDTTIFDARNIPVHGRTEHQPTTA